jgi:hypothetical protein
MNLASARMNLADLASPLGFGSALGPRLWKSAKGSIMSRMVTRLCVLVACLPLALLAACGGGGNDAPKCIVGASAACACPTGQQGAQICTSVGTFGACVWAPAGVDGGTAVPGIKCVAGESAACACPTGQQGALVCTSEGLFGTCACAAPGVGGAPGTPLDAASARLDTQPDAPFDAPASTATLAVDRTSVDLVSSDHGLDGGATTETDGGSGTSIELGSSGTATVFVTNTGDTASGALAIVAGAGVATSGCSGALAPSASCTLAVTAAPTTLGPFTSTVSIWATPGAVTPIMITVSAVVVPKPAQLVIPTCNTQVVSNGYSCGAATSCADCKDNNGNSREDVCKEAIDCIVEKGASCDSNCQANCRNLAGDQFGSACVQSLQTAACSGDGCGSTSPNGGG